MKHREVEEFLLNLPNTELTFPFGEEVAVYKVTVGDDQKMFALIAQNKDPVNLSLKCDPQLASVLRERYESVMPGYHLNKKHWNTVILSGQLTDDEVKDLINHSYILVSEGSDTDTPSF